MAILVHDPKTLISGQLAEGAQSGTANIYEWADPTGVPGRKIDSVIANNSSTFWRADDANLIGHVIKDIVNEGTVVLFSASNSASVGVAGISATLLSSGTKWDAASGTLNLVSSSYVATSQSVGAWTKSGVFTGPFAASFSSSYSVSGTLVLLSSTISSNYGTTLNNGLRIGNLEGAATATAISSTLWGEGFLPWVNGVSGALSALSTSFYESDLVDNLVVSGALKQIAMEFLGTPNLLLVFSGTGGATGSHPTGSYNNLREAFYALTASFNSLSGVVSSSVGSGSNASGSIASLSGVVYPMSSAFYPISATYGAVSGAASESLATGSALSGVLYPLSTSFYPISSTYTAVSGAASSSVATGSQLSGVLYPLSSAFYPISSTYTAVSGAASSSVATGSQLSGVLYPLSSAFYPLSSAFYPISSSYGPLSQSVSGVFNSSSLAPVSIYMKSPNGSIWKIDIDNAGVLSSSLA